MNKHKPSDTAITCPSPRVKNRIIDAFIVHTPDLSFSIRLQNLINYLIDNINDSIVEENTSSTSDKIDTCLKHIETIISNNSDSIGKELQSIIAELVEEGHHYQTILQTSKLQSSLLNESLETLLTVKATQIQWLGVCLLQELKKPFLKS